MVTENDLRPYFENGVFTNRSRRNYLIAKKIIRLHRPNSVFEEPIVTSPEYTKVNDEIDDFLKKNKKYVKGEVLPNPFKKMETIEINPDDVPF